jgi:hypothetical protein
LLWTGGVTYPAPRQQCIEDPHKAVDKLVANDEAIKIVGGFNKKLGSDPRLIATVCAKNNLFDIQAHFHGDQAQTPTYARGSTRLGFKSVGQNIRVPDEISRWSAFDRHPEPLIDCRPTAREIGNNEAIVSRNKGR